MPSVQIKDVPDETHSVLRQRASVLATALADDGADGDQARARSRGESLAAPEPVDLEVGSVLRRLVLSGALPVRRAEQAMTDLPALPVRRAPHRPPMWRCWALRGSTTVDDAAYVALAEAMSAVLLTADVRLSRAPGLQCTVEVLHRP